MTAGLKFIKFSLFILMALEAYCDSREEGLQLVQLLAACRFSSIGRINVTQPMVCVSFFRRFQLANVTRPLLYLISGRRLVEQTSKSNWGRSGQCGEGCYLQVNQFE